MNWRDFEISVGGKWVLAGEHAVVRGATAIALPLKEYQLKLQFRPSETRHLNIEPEEHASVIRELLNSVEDRWQANDRSFIQPTGNLSITSTIPLGAGMGSSAALCVALTRWLQNRLQLPEPEVFEFAKELEHRFHGRSSGMDVAVVLAGQPISYSLSKGARPLGVRDLPHFTFHDTGVRMRTSDCVHKVEIMKEDTPSLALSIDELMGSASRDATEGLLIYDSGQKAQGLELVARAMSKARECFYSWGLVPDAARHLEEDLLGKGALSVKLTGAGGGGMLVALWGSKP